MVFTNAQYAKIQRPNPDWYLYRAIMTKNTDTIKPSQGRLYMISCVNFGSSIKYLQLYDDSATTNSANLVDVIPVYSNSGGAVLTSEYFGAYGTVFLNGITWGVSTGYSGFTPATAGEIIFRAGYL